MNTQLLCKQGQQGKLSQNFTTLLEYIQSADPNSPDFDEDNKYQGWGHYQFTAGGLNLLSSLTLWQDVGSITFAFELVAAAIKTCWEAWLMCANARKLTAGGFISDAYLQETLNGLKKCWIGAGGVSAYFLRCFHTFTTSRLLPLPSLLLTPNTLLPHLHIVMSQSHLHAGSSQSQAAIYSRCFQCSHRS